MNEPGRKVGVADELRPYVDRSEAELVNLVGERLADNRPIPRAGFRAQLRFHLIELSGRRRHARPKNLRALVAAYGLAGTACLAFAALGLTGAGPLSP